MHNSSFIKYAYDLYLLHFISLDTTFRIRHSSTYTVKTGMRYTEKKRKEVYLNNTWELKRNEESGRKYKNGATDKTLPLADNDDYNV